MLQELRKLTTYSVNAWDTADEIETDEYVPDAAPLATWWVQKSPGTTYIRCVVPARKLPGQALHFRWSDAKVDDLGEAILPRQRGNAAIWQFVGNANRALFMAHQQSYLGNKVFMEVDDNYLVPPPPVPGTNRDWARSLDRSSMDRYSFQAHRKIIRWVDGVIVATAELAERYSKATTAPVYHCPNSADLDDWPEVTERELSAERKIGFAGSASHRYDLALVERAMDWAWRQPNVTLYKLGGVGGVWNLPHESLPWTDDLTQYRKNLQALDVGLCPLKSSDWHDCKSDLKAIEYTLSGIVPIVSKAPPYRDWFDVVPTCATEKDWLKAVKWAANAPAEELREVWDRAYRFVLEHKVIDKHISKWREAIA